jgi:N-acetylmuramoyl-L-alanine amidase
VKNKIGWIHFLGAVALALLLLSAAPGWTPAAASSDALASAETMTVNTGALNVRSGPSVGYSVVTVLTYGQVVTPIGRNAYASWVQIQVSGTVKGWVNGRYLSGDVDINALPVMDEAMPTAVINTGLLNVRSGPGVGYAILTVTYQGYVVKLLGRNASATWAKIELPNRTQGWVNASLVIPSAPISSLPVLYQDSPTAGQTAVVVTGALNVRSGPGVSYSPVTVVSYGQVVMLLGRNSLTTWANIRLPDGREGWVNASFLQLSVPLASLPNTETSAAPTLTATVTAWALNVRSGPGVTHNITAGLSYGQQVTLIGRNSDATWGQVRLANGMIGWVNLTYLKTEVNIAALPVTG